MNRIIDGVNDIALPLSGDLRVTASGDLRLIDGVENLRAAIERRHITEPGAMVHRPEYGVGLVGAVESIATAADLDRVAVASRRNTLQDPRVAEARTTVVRGRRGSPNAAGVTVSVQARVRGQQDDELIEITAG